MPVADLILKNAKVITVDPSQPVAELVAIRGEKILLVADNASLESVRGSRTKIIDCQGKTLVPGFNDAHCHIFSFLRKLLSLDLAPSVVSSISDIKAAIAREAPNTPRGQWITGTGYNEFYLAEKRHPTRWDIDEVSPHHPVVLAHRSLHACVVNSHALSLAGISRDTVDPPGARIDRDPDTGEPTGLLFEMLGYIREKLMPSLSEAKLTQGVRLANEHYLSQGITSLQDATVVNDFKRWQRFRRFQDAGKLLSRIYMMFDFDAMSEFQEAGMTTGAGDEHLRLGGLKIMLREPTGQLHPPREELDQQALTAHRAGFQVSLHAIQPSVVEAAIITFEHLPDQPSLPVRRHRIEHCSECPPHLLERLKKLRTVIVTQPPFIYYSGERYMAVIPTTDLRWLYRIKDFIDSDLVVAGSSDSPTVPVNPLVGIYSAVTRRSESAQQLPLEESVSASQALALYTINAAYASFEENIKGSITRGKLADLVLLSDDPTTVPPERIKEIKVEMTVLGGKVVWEA